MRRSLLFIFCVLAVSISHAYDNQQTGRTKVQKNGSQYVKSSNKNKEKVYYCKGSGAYSFHLYRDCSGLNHCGGEIVEMGQKAAQDSLRNRCKNCWKRLQKETDGTSR